MIKKQVENVKKDLTICIEFNCDNFCVSCMLKGARDYLKPICLNEYKKILKENLKSDKFSRIILSGAEVTMNPSLKKFIEYAKKLENINHIRIQSNGRKLSDYKYCKELVNAGVDEFFISIYGPNFEVHERLTNTIGSYKETFEGINNVNKLRTVIITNTVITSLNYQTLPYIVKSLSSFSYLKEIQFWNYLPISVNGDFSLLESYVKVKPFLIRAIKEGKKNNINIVVKYFPECLLSQYRKYLNNSQPNVKGIDCFFVDKLSACGFQKSMFCSYKECRGLPLAYKIRYRDMDNKCVRPYVPSSLSSRE